MSAAASRSSPALGFDEVICWTRMQSEAGQALEQIIARKELERRSGDGVFFWGVGNPPAVATAALARLRTPVKAIFSIMKSRPKAIDATPKSLLVWRRYIDKYGMEKEIPPNVLVTSRGDAGSSEKRRHYALMCYSPKPLRIEHGVGFDPKSYRNASGNGAPIGASQVTALLQKVKESETGDYEANLTAQLTGSYWVKLADPARLDHEAMMLSDTASGSDHWLAIVSKIRSGPAVEQAEPGQRSLF